MKLKSLSLNNFRSYSSKSITFKNNVTIFTGPNAIGKTNILEAIVFLALGKSYRAQKNEEAIKFDQEFSRISGEVDEKSLEIVLTHGFYQGKKTNKKRYLINGVGKRRKDFINNLKIVLFQPEDIELVIGSPSHKRHYLDFVLSQIDNEYDRSLLSYQKGLRQRNKLLHLIAEGKATINQLEFWNRLLIKNGEIIRNKRQEFLNFLNTNCHLKNYAEKNHVHPQTLPSFYFKYNPNTITPKRLVQYQTAEIASKNTLIGPHRDKFDIFQYFKDREKQKDISLYGSRGEQRISILTLKLAELEYITQKSDERPLLLLDDIFSELDNSFQHIVLDTVKKQQTIITTTDLDGIKTQDLNNMEIIELKK